MTEHDEKWIDGGEVAGRWQSIWAVVDLVFSDTPVYEVTGLKRIPDNELLRIKGMNWDLPTWEKCLPGFLFRFADVEHFEKRSEIQSPNEIHTKQKAEKVLGAKDEILRYAKERWDAGCPLVHADFEPGRGRSLQDETIIAICKNHNVAGGTLRKHLNKTGLLQPGKRGPKPTQK
jgi:hypothetical protein